MIRPERSSSLAGSAAASAIRAWAMSKRIPDSSRRRCVSERGGDQLVAQIPLAITLQEGGPIGELRWRS